MSTLCHELTARGLTSTIVCYALSGFSLCAPDFTSSSIDNTWFKNYVLVHVINRLKPSGYYMYHLIFPISICAFCIHGPCMILTVNGDYFIKQH
jgi:hypothetical protein